MAVSANGGVVVCGTECGSISFRETHSFNEIHRISLAAYGAVQSLWFSEGERGKRGARE